MLMMLELKNICMISKDKNHLQKETIHKPKIKQHQKRIRGNFTSSQTKTLGCGHEIEAMDQSGECIICCGQSPFDEFKQKCSNVFRALQQLDNDDFFKCLQSLDDPLMTSLSKQRCQSSTGELFKDPMNYSRLADQQIQQIIRKCLRCNKDVQNHDSKNISYFCNSCKNF